MKNATAYERKMKKLLAGMSKSAHLSAREDCMEVLIQGILEADAQRRQAEKALEAMLEEFVDVNELRVAPHKEITDCMGRDFPRAREKAETMTGVLNRIFDHSTSLSLDYVHELPKREIRRHLKELGLDAYASALLALACFQAHAVPVDRMLVDCLEADELIHPGSEVADVQGFLERIIPQKDSRAAHEFLRSYAEKRAKSLPPKAAPVEAAPANNVEPAAAAPAKPAPEEPAPAKPAKPEKTAQKPAAKPPAKPVAKARPAGKIKAKAKPAKGGAR